MPFFGFEFAEKLRVPCVNASVVPLIATRDFANPHVAAALAAGRNLQLAHASPHGFHGLAVVWQNDQSVAADHVELAADFTPGG